MFWRFGGYANISTIDTILDKPDFQLEDLLEESDLIQELKQHNTKLIEYLREEKVLEKLLEYVVAPKLEPVGNPDGDDDSPDEDKKGRLRGLPFTRPRASSRAMSEENDEDEAEKKRNRYAYVAAEILSSDNWSIYEALMETPSLLRNFWNFLNRPAPLDPLQASYFTKVNESLFDKKTEEMVELVKSLDNAIPNVLRHVDCPLVMDLLLKIISLERSDNGQGIVEWLHTKDVMPTLLSFLGPSHSWATQTSAGDFIKAIITVSANASQNEQACIGPNELTRQLVSKDCVETLIGYMLGGGNALTVGVGIIIEVIRKNNSDYDPDVATDSNTPPSSRDPIYLGTLLRLFAEHVPDFMNLILNAPAQRRRLDSTFGDQIEPLGFDRFKTCELMAELLHCSNMGLLNQVGSEQVIALRDSERQRLRAEGKLAPNRGEEAQSPDDLTMRTRISSPDDNRRLEVTNASDDDGFEEVTPSGDMTEDTSHEFVKAEEEIPGSPTASFLDKDDDDFVDEPLSSPRLKVQDGKANEQQFENPELVVAPLSPRKQTITPADTQAVDTAVAAESSSTGRSSTDNSATPKEDEPVGSVNLDSPSGAKPSPAETADQPPPQSDLQLPLRTTDATVKEEHDAPRPSTTGATVPDVSSGASEPKAVSSETAPQQGDSGTPSGASLGEASTSIPHELDSAPSGTGDQQLQPVSFFFKYPWNNFLHNVVYDIVQQVFNGPMDRGYNPTLAISLFEAADITNAIINGQSASEKSQTQSKTRMGYMGHLTLIAEEVVKFTERNPPELLSQLVMDRVMSQDWINYVEGALAETRERDNAILGGVRPEVAMNSRGQMGGSGLGGMGLSSLGLSAGQGGSNALAEAGLTAGGSNTETQDNGSGSSLGPFSISSGLLSGSGFGSSSDEDEDDAEDNEEDVNNEDAMLIPLPSVSGQEAHRRSCLNGFEMQYERASALKKEFRAYTDTMNAGSSMDPPSIPPPPPPPPPLNVPPSRARLQLAARLAMHQKNAAAASAQSAEVENNDAADDSKLPDNSESILRNPFDDDGGDVDDDSDDGFGEGENAGDSWTAGRGSWWLRRGKERFDDSKGDSDSDKDETAGNDNDDEEFGDFAMPEVDKEGDNEKTNVIVKPLPVHPPQNQKSSPFTLWPFGSKDKEKQKSKEGGEPENRDEPQDVRGEDGEKLKSTHQAARRTSIEEPDDEEVVV
ncbi:hypothetical protein DL768_002274 [Monosporascus sp. mg162]|nr:hypothetical protein DL768_002274 [Monosporascus sp. mg162]